MNHAKGFIKAYDYNEAEVYQGFSSLNWGHALCVGNGDIGVVRGDTLCVGCIVRGGGFAGAYGCGGGGVCAAGLFGVGHWGVYLLAVFMGMRIVWRSI